MDILDIWEDVLNKFPKLQKKCEFLLLFQNFRIGPEQNVFNMKMKAICFICNCKISISIHCALMGWYSWLASFGIGRESLDINPVGVQPDIFWDGGQMKPGKRTKNETKRWFRNIQRHSAGAFVVWWEILNRLGAVDSVQQRGSHKWNRKEPQANKAEYISQRNAINWNLLLWRFMGCNKPGWTQNILPFCPQRNSSPSKSCFLSQMAN